MARTYKRDNRGRFASTGSARGARPATRMATRGANLLTRDNAGRITSVGGDGATARGGRLRTASGKARGKVLARIGGGGGKLRKPAGVKAGAAKASKVDLTDAGFTRRLGRAKASLKRAQAEYAARGSSIYDKTARRRVQTLESAVGTLSYARKTVRNATVPASKIKTTDRTIIDNYNRQLSATKRKAASTPSGGRKTTAPRLTPSEKAAVTRAKNKAARDAAQRRRWEQSRRYG